MRRIGKKASRWLFGLQIPALWRATGRFARQKADNKKRDELAFLNCERRGRMQIYLPIAEMSANIMTLIGMGGLVGFMSGMFGVGGGFLMTPLLIFIGVPPAVAVASEANQIVASVSGGLAYWQRRAIDVPMGLILMAGGLVGSYSGVQISCLARARASRFAHLAVLCAVFIGHWLAHAAREHSGIECAPPLPGVGASPRPA